MKRAVALLVVAACSAAFAADPSDMVHEAALGWMQGAVKQDAAALSRFLSDDLQYAHAGGQKQTKSEYIAAVTKGPARYESFTLSDLKIVGAYRVLRCQNGGTGQFSRPDAATLRGKQRTVADGRAPIHTNGPLTSRAG